VRLPEGLPRVVARLPTTIRAEVKANLGRMLAHQGLVDFEVPGRAERGVALVTDIHSNTARQQALELGSGRIFDRWVVVPGEVGETLTQGGVLSFYESTTPMAERLTDVAGGERVAHGTLPRDRRGLGASSRSDDAPDLAAARSRWSYAEQ